MRCFFVCLPFQGQIHLPHPDFAVAILNLNDSAQALPRQYYVLLLVLHLLQGKIHCLSIDTFLLGPPRSYLLQSSELSPTPRTKSLERDTANLPKLSVESRQLSSGVRPGKTSSK